VNLALLVNDKPACQSKAIYGKDGGTEVNGEKWETINSYTQCEDPIKIRAGDSIKLRSEYDISKHKL
jgi:hypothetical protein